MLNITPSDALKEPCAPAPQPAGAVVPSTNTPLDSPTKSIPVPSHESHVQGASPMETNTPGAASGMVTGPVVSINYVMDEIIAMRHFSRLLQSKSHTQLALSQHCLNSDIPLAGEDHPNSGTAAPLKLTIDQPGLDLPLRIVSDRNAESNTAYDPQAAATRYSMVLEDGINQPELGIWHQILVGAGAYDWNSLAREQLDPRAVAVTGLKWKYHLAPNRGDEVESFDARRMLCGSVMPRYGVGKTIITSYPRSITQPSFFRYIVSLPYERVVIVNLCQPYEEGVAKTCLPSYRKIITHNPVEFDEVLHDNTESPENRTEWAAIHAQWKRRSHHHAENDAVRQKALDMAHAQIKTVPYSASAEPTGASKGNPPMRANSSWNEEVMSHVLEGYIGTKKVTNIHFGKWRANGSLGRSRAALMRMVLRYLLPSYAGCEGYGKAGAPVEKTAIMLLCSDGKTRSGTLYVVLRYLDAVLNSLDPLDVSNMSPSLPSRHNDNLAEYEWHDPSCFVQGVSSITPTAPRRPMVIPARIQQLTPHLVPIMRLIDQTAEFRNGCTDEEGRMMLYDMVQIVLRRGIEGLMEEDAWTEEEASVNMRDSIVQGKDGVEFRPWRGIRYLDETTRGDRLSQKRAQSAIERLDRAGAQA